MLCLKCKAELTAVNYTALAHVAGTFDLEEQSHEFDEEYDNENIKYQCPECGVDLTEAVNKIL